MATDAAVDDTQQRAPVVALAWLWGTWSILFIFQALLHTAASSTTLLALVMTPLHVVLTCIILLTCFDLRVASLVILGFGFRVVAMLIDLYAPFELPITATPDDIRFLAAGEAISSNPSLAGETYGGAYSSLLGYMFWLVGPDRLTPQYLNVLLGTSSLVVLVAILRRLSVPPKVLYLLLALGSLLPAPALFSAQLLREALVQFLVSASMAFFLAGVLKRRWPLLLMASLLILGGSLFHAGVVAILLGYAAILALFRTTNGQMKFNLRGLLPTVVGATALTFILWRFPGAFLAKFAAYGSETDLLASANRRDGAAAYLTGLQLDDPQSLLVFAPLRAIYFLLSPLPWDWRGPRDILAFAVDSLFYLIAVVSVLFRRALKDRKGLLLVFVVVLSVVSVVFGLGVSNSGTAIRHRSKFVTLFIAMLAIVLSRKSRAAPERMIEKSTSRQGRVSQRAV